MSTRTALGLSVFLTFTPGTSGRGRRRAVGATLGARLAAKPTGADAEALAEEIRAWFGKDRAGKDNVINGAPPKVEGLETAWAIEAPGAKTAAVVTSDGKTLPLCHVGDTPDFRRHVPLAHGSAFRWSYVTDGNKEGRKGQLEVYTDPPELAEKPGVPKGKLTHQKPWESKIFPNTKREWWVYVPAQYKDDQPACVMVFQDGAGYTGFVPTVFDNLIAKGEMPVTVAVFINPGNGPRRGGPRPAQRRVRHVVRPLRPVPARRDPARGRKDGEAPPRPREPRHRRDQQRRHLRLDRRLGAPGRVSQGPVVGRQLHQHRQRQDPARRGPQLRGLDPQDAQEADPRLPPGWRQRPRQRQRQLAAGQPADGQGPRVREVRLQFVYRPGLSQQPPRPRHPARLAPLALARLQARR